MKPLEYSTHHTLQCNSTMPRMWKPVLWRIPLVLFMAFLVPTLAKYKHINRKIMPILEETNSYAVVFDAGSSGSRVHVFSFDSNLDLVPIEEGSDEYELFLKTKPGLSSYASEPQAAAESLEPLLVKAENAVPEALRPLPASILEGNASAILEAVRDLFMYNSTLKCEDDSVSILSGAKEGSYMWIAINDLLGNVGNEYKDTVGIVDLGGGSVQMAYAISESAAATAPKAPEGDEPYVAKLLLKKSNYHIYVHSYLSYGLLAARAQILKALILMEARNTRSQLLHLAQTWRNAEKQSLRSSMLMKHVRMITARSMEFGMVEVEMDRRTYIWGPVFYDKPAQVGFINYSAPASAKVIPSFFMDVAKILCNTTFEDASKYPKLLDPAFVCMDLVYEYTLLVDGFGEAFNY
ncbi:hypothetical protein Tsubulata_015476 [Turnera subulata]|uniref:Apyrase n=1 Tax=Turnera subulata TaxID=218843 RepID=A0A9Q0GDK2_9ROSI|nr:hypothetical protein Tsubulata_015476 [Turnera subulata]